MRRLFVMLAGVGLVSTTGCYHLAGKCDCVPPVQPCHIYGLYPAGYGWATVSQTAAPAAATATPASAEVTVPAIEVMPVSQPQLPKEQIGLPREM